MGHAGTLSYKMIFNSLNSPFIRNKCLLLASIVKGATLAILIFLPMNAMAFEEVERCDSFISEQIDDNTSTGNQNCEYEVSPGAPNDAPVAVSEVAGLMFASAVDNIEKKDNVKVVTGDSDSNSNQTGSTASGVINSDREFNDALGAAFSEVVNQ